MYLNDQNIYMTRFSSFSKMLASLYDPMLKQEETEKLNEHRTRNAFQNETKYSRVNFRFYMYINILNVINLMHPTEREILLKMNALRPQVVGQSLQMLRKIRSIV